MENTGSSEKRTTSRPSSRRGFTRGQIRNERRQRNQRQKQRRQRLYILIAGLIAIGLIVGLVAPYTANNNTTSGSEVGPLIDDAADPDGGRTHVDPLSGHEPYITVPATSGPHYNTPSVIVAGGMQVKAPADWGVYDFALPDEVLVHNLEHGGIGLHYDCDVTTTECQDIVSFLDSFLTSHRTQFIMSPYPGIFEHTTNTEDTASRIAITGWRHHIYIPDTSDESSTKIRDFITTYQNRAPEPRFDNQFAGHQ